MAAESTHEVFLSYSSKDKAWADAACAVLERHRIRCWIAPRDITPGDEWGAAIIKGLNGSRMMVLIFSGHANDSGQVRREVERAISQGMTVLPIRIEDIRPEGAMEYALGNTHWLDAFTPPVERHLEMVAQSVKTLLGKGSRSKAPDRLAPATPQVIGDKPRRLQAGWLIAIAASILGLAALGAIMIMMKTGGGEAKATGSDLARKSGPPSNAPGAKPAIPPGRVPPAGPARRASLVRGSVWSVEGDQLVKEGLGDGWVVFGDQDWTDYDLTFEARQSAPPVSFGGGFRGSDSEWVYLFGFDGLVNKASLTRWSIATKDGPFLRTVSCAVQPMKWYKVKASLRGPNIRTQLDGRAIISFTDDSSRRGPACLRIFKGAGRFRNIKVTAPDGTILWEGPPDLPGQ